MERHSALLPGIATTTRHWSHLTAGSRVRQGPLPPAFSLTHPCLRDREWDTGPAAMETAFLCNRAEVV
ncbi:MAG: hypothetical protein KDH19_19400 [Geminicoccaceae bacterium]|nr:hypothetical protein [Geminicoccaceae bacterium]